MNVDYKALTLSATRSTIAYLDPEDVNRIWSNSSKNETNICYYIFKDVLLAPKFHSDEKTDAVAYTWVQNRTLHIVFRGTSTAKDVKIDINILREPLFEENKQILVHKGFLTQLKSLETELRTEIISRQKSVDTIHFSGHSLGAALATLASGLFSKILRIYNKRIVCHTIGSSRVGNKAFVDWYDGRVDESIRIFNFKDPVPLLPISVTYCHINGGLKLCTDGTVKTIGKDKPWYIRILRFPFAIYYRNPVSHHACSMYMSRLAKLASWDINRDIS